MKFLTLVKPVLSTPFHELLQRAVSNQIECDPLMTLPDDYVPHGYRRLGQIAGPLSLASMSMLRALGPYENRFKMELSLLDSRSAPSSETLPVSLMMEKVEERISALRTLLEAAALLQYPAVAVGKHYLVEGTLMVQEDTVLEPLWDRGESGVEACWKAFLRAVSGDYENPDAMSRFVGEEYCCEEHHETQNPDLCFDAKSHPVTRSLLHFWAFALRERKRYELPTNEEQLRAWKATKGGAMFRALDTFVRLGNQLFFAAVHDVHPSIRGSGGGGRGLVVMKDHMVVQHLGLPEGFVLGGDLEELLGGMIVRVVRR